MIHSVITASPQDRSKTAFSTISWTCLRWSAQILSMSIGIQSAVQRVHPLLCLSDSFMHIACAGKGGSSSAENKKDYQRKSRERRPCSTHQTKGNTLLSRASL
ncbi:hypothetical protein PBY51_009022 [Eleginops maclovinus]|nr:hypothetical protein PBY51_009022 [Eleginops maclovinus]